ncbi:MAG: HAD-IA family hydrolase [Verrucomicrobia bacterium]|nr:HAD-IA family hydrolase [Verrucomicrobiota bacterium]
MMDLQALVFDFDGLVVNTEEPGFVSWRELYHEFGQTLTLNDWTAATGYVGGFDPHRHLEGLLGRPLDWSVLAPRREARNWELTLREPVLPGIKELMSAAKAAGLPLGVASNSGWGWVDEGLRRLDLRRYIDAVVTRDLVLNPKPAPDMYLKCVQILNVVPAAAVALEDSEPGARAAKNAGLKVVAIPNQFSALQNLSFVDLRVASASELDLDRLRALVRAEAEGASPSAARAIATTIRSS